MSAHLSVCPHVPSRLSLGGLIVFLPTNALNVNLIQLKMSKTVKYQLAPTCFGNSTILREHTSFLTKATLVKN
jgi:hypothetical protein